jgi:hypothetical protein
MRQKRVIKTTTITKLRPPRNKHILLSIYLELGRMPEPEKIYLPSRHYREQYPLSRLRPLANFAITAPAESPRGPFLELLAKEMGGAVLGNTDFVTRQRTFEQTEGLPVNDELELEDWILPTEEELEASRSTRKRFAEPAIYDRNYQYPGWIVKIRRDTNGNPITDINGKADTYVFPTEGIYMGIRGLKYSFKGAKLTERIEPMAVRAYGSRSDIRFGVDIPVLSDFSLDPDRPTSASFTQKGFSISFTERHQKNMRGNPAAVFFAARAGIRGVMGDTLRVYKPDEELKKALSNRRQSEKDARLVTKTNREISGLIAA